MSEFDNLEEGLSLQDNNNEEGNEEKGNEVSNKDENDNIGIQSSENIFSNSKINFV